MKPQTPEEAWQDLLEKDDRTSPAECPQMSLITFDEFTQAIQAAVEAERAWWMRKHIEISAMTAPKLENAIICGGKITTEDANQIGWGNCSIAWQHAIRARKPYD